MASGINTAAFQIGGAFGAAIVTTVVVAQSGGDGAEAITASLRAGYVAAGVFSAGAFLAALSLRRMRRAGRELGTGLTVDDSSLAP